MVITVSSLLRAGLAVSLLGAIIISAFAPPPSGRARRIRPSWMMVLAVALYAAGVVLAIGGYFGLAGLTCVTGIAAFAVATWLSRPADPGEPPADDGRDDGDPPSGPTPPHGPEDAVLIDWDAFEREVSSWAQERRARV